MLRRLLLSRFDFRQRVATTALQHVHVLLHLIVFKKTSMLCDFDTLDILMECGVCTSNVSVSGCIPIHCVVYTHVFKNMYLIYLITNTFQPK